jgi:Mg-chelatase subunit ChlD
MRKELTDITMVVDRSGSMSMTQSDAEGGINEFIKTQQTQPGDAVLTLVQFDTEVDIIHKATPIRAVPKYDLIPRGNTALLDAVGKAIVEAGERLAAMSEADRPGLVVFVIVTDGQENSSKEYKKAQIKQMIDHQQTNYKWHFLYIGANQDAFAEAGAMGIAKGHAAGYASNNPGRAYKTAGSHVAGMRGQALSDQPIATSFSEEERTAMSDTK